MSSSALRRRPYRGSCHCGHIRYICYLTLPPQEIHPEAPVGNTFIKKCNCRICHKMGFFHVRLADAPNDFVLLSPADPFTHLSDYQCGTHFAHLFFCGTCGIRCFAFGPDEQHGESVTIDLEAWLGQEGQGKLTTVWRPKKDGYEEEKTSILRVNATSLDANESLDLREWHDKGFIAYEDGLENLKEKSRLGKPFRGGMY